MYAVLLSLSIFLSLTVFAPLPKYTRVCTCAGLSCLYLKHFFLNSIRNPKKLPPQRAIVIQRPLFVPVFARCAVGFGVRSEGSGWTRPHGAPDRVDTVAYPEAWQQPLKRGGPEKWIRPLALTFFPVHLPPDWRGRGPHSWARSPVPVLLATSYWPVFSKWTLIIYRLHGRPFDLMSPLNVFLEPAQTRDKTRSHQSWGASPEMWRTFCFAPAEQTLHHHNYVETRGINPTISGRTPWNLLTNQMDLHNTQRPPFCRGSTVDLSHMKENLSHCSLPINQFKSDQGPSTCPLLYWGI